MHHVTLWHQLVCPLCELRQNNCMTACDYARDLSKSLLVLGHMVFFSFFFFFKCYSHKMVLFQSETGTRWYRCSTDQLWHYSSWTWWPREPVAEKTPQNSLEARFHHTCLAQDTRVNYFNAYHIHGRATQRGCHGVCLEMTRKPKVSWRVRETGGSVFLLNLYEHIFILHLDHLMQCWCKSLPNLKVVLMELDLRPSGWQSKMFWGLRSLWTMPLLCRTFMARDICCRNTWMVSSLRVPLAVDTEREKEIQPDGRFIMLDKKKRH